MLKKKCEYCGKTFVAKYKNKKFCSILCYSEYQHTQQYSLERKELKIKSLIRHNRHIGPFIKTCLECGKQFQTKDNRQKFCSNRCSAFHSNRTRVENGWKFPQEIKDKISSTIKSKYLNGLFHVVDGRYVNTSLDKIEKYKIINRNNTIKRLEDLKCRICGCYDCPRPEICNSFFVLKKNPLLEKLGFDYSKIGTIEVINEYEKLRDNVCNLYDTQKLSITQISRMYSVKSTTTIWLLLKFCNIQRRSFKQSVQLSVLNGTYVPISKTDNPKYRFRCGWHTTWNNKQVYYRSSYELKYCKQLDLCNIDYDMESLRIQYFDTVKNIQRLSIPDFYISSENLIVEIKSDRTYIQQEMIDKFRAYKRNGYDYKLILEGIDYGKRLPETRKCCWINDKK